MSNTTNASDAAEGRRIVLVIGVNEAPMSFMPSLKHAVADAEAMAEVLQQFGKFELLLPPLLDERADSATIKKALLKMVMESTEEDILLLYFSGHGIHMPVEKEDQPGVDQVYLVTSDFCEQEVEMEPTLHLSMRWLRDNFFNKTIARQVLIILDCCSAGDIGRTGPDPQAQDLLQQIVSYFDLPGTSRSTRPGKLRLALTATGHNLPSGEKDGHGIMTGPLLRALCGKVDTLLLSGEEGKISLMSLYEYLLAEMPLGQKPSLSGDWAAQNYVLASYPERAAELRRTRTYRVVKERPNTYIPFPRNPLFQPRPGEFEHLETLLFGFDTEQQPLRLGLVGVVGLGGVGKTQLAVELAYRCLDQQRFPAGTFWMPATGTSVFEWPHQFAELALSTDYLPPDDDPSSPENEARRARHFCRYLATHRDSLLILDNVEDPNLVTYVLPALAGVQVDCPILYTSRNQTAPIGVSTYPVRELPADAALRLLLETTRPTLLSEVLGGSMSGDAQAARRVCHDVGYLPLALVQLRGLLDRDRHVTLSRLAEVLKQRGALEIAKTQQGDTAPLFATFRLSWEKVESENARTLFKLASYFPEATPIPRWLLGLASGLGEQDDIFEPLGEACLRLQELSLLEELSGEQVRLHPLVREFGRRLVAEENDNGRPFLERAAERLVSEFEDLKGLEQRARRSDYWECLEQVRAARDYVELLGTDHKAHLAHIERWLDRESYLFRDEQLWPEAVPGLFYQQLYNRSVEEEQPLTLTNVLVPWLRQMREVNAEDRSLLRIFAGHSDSVSSVAFSPDGQLVLTGSRDSTARLWETSSGKQVGVLEGHSNSVSSVAFSPDGRFAITCDQHGRVYFWQVNGMERGKLVGLYVATYEVGAVYWQDAAHVVLADLGGPHFRPHFYYLKLEGNW